MFQTKKGSFFFHRHTCIQWLHSFSLYNALYTLVTLFCCCIRNFLSHIFSYAQLLSVCFTLKLCFLLQNTLSTNVTVVSDKEGVIFFSLSHLYTVVTYIMHWIHLSHIFAASLEIFCPIYSVVHSSSQSVPHWNSVFSFKIHCLQMLQLFQTKKRSFFFIVTHVYSGYIAFPYIMHCIHFSHFFAASSEILCPIYSVMQSSSQSVSHWNSVSTFKIHCLQMLQLFQTKKGSFFSSSHLYTVVT